VAKPPDSSEGMCPYSRRVSAERLPKSRLLPMGAVCSMARPVSANPPDMSASSSRDRRLIIRWYGCVERSGASVRGFE
jgi:hypothetical protein